VVNVSRKLQFLHGDLCLGDAVPGECLSDSGRAEVRADGGDTAEQPGVTAVKEFVDNSVGDLNLACRVAVVTSPAGQAQDTATAECDLGAEGHACAPGARLMAGDPPPAAAASGSSNYNGEPVDVDSVLDFDSMSDVELFSLFDGQFVHVKPLIDELPSDLTSVERRKVAELILRNADLWSRHEYDLGLTQLTSHHIETGNHTPIAETLRRHPRVYLDVIDQSIDNLARAGIVEPCSSPWAANIVPVKKKGSSMPRGTVDYHKLNKITVKDRFHLPRISDCLDALSGAVWFSTYDQSHSFFQLPLETEADRNKTAFITRRGHFRFTVLPMGASNSLSVFARLMSLVLHGLTYLCCLVFIDDTVVMSRSFD